MKNAWICLMAVSALALAAGAEERIKLYQEARLMSADGSQPVKAAAVKFRGAEATVPTDTNGNVAVYFESPAFDRDSTDVTFRNAVSVEGGDEIELGPALRLGSAPAAIHADEADEALEGQFAPGGEGRATFGALTADRAYVDDKVTLNGDTDVYGPITGVENLYIGSLTVGSNTVGNAMLRPKFNNDSELSFIFNKNAFNYYVEENPGQGYVSGDGLGILDLDKDENGNAIIKDDGFAWVAACSGHSKSAMDGSWGCCMALVTISVWHDGKKTVYADHVDCRTNSDSMSVGDKASPKNVSAPAFCFLVPVRRGDRLQVRLSTFRNHTGGYWLTAYCGVRLVYFGVESAN